MILFAIDPGVNGACSIYVDRKLCKIFDVPTMTDGKKNKKQINAAQLSKIVKQTIEHQKEEIIIHKFRNFFCNYSSNSN